MAMTPAAQEESGRAEPGCGASKKLSGRLGSKAKHCPAARQGRALQQSSSQANWRGFRGNLQLDTGAWLSASTAPLGLSIGKELGGLPAGVVACCGIGANLDTDSADILQNRQAQSRRRQSVTAGRDGPPRSWSWRRMEAGAHRGIAPGRARCGCQRRFRSPSSSFFGAGSASIDLDHVCCTASAGGPPRLFAQQGSFRRALRPHCASAPSGKIGTPWQWSAISRPASGITSRRPVSNPEIGHLSWLLAGGGEWQAQVPSSSRSSKVAGSSRGEPEVVGAGG